MFDVPGAFELPLAALYLAESGRYAGVACLGAVIRGETDHYDYVCSEAARGIQDVQLRTGVPCAFGVLTVDNMDQAIARTGGGKRDSGRARRTGRHGLVGAARAATFLRHASRSRPRVPVRHGGDASRLGSRGHLQGQDQAGPQGRGDDRMPTGS